MKAEMGKTKSYWEMASHDRLTVRRCAVFVMCLALFTLSQFYRVSNAIIAPQLQRDLSLSPDSLGLVSAIFFYAFALTQIPIALSLDHFGARRLMTALTFVSAVGGLIFATAQGVQGAVVGRALLGLGMAGNFMGPLKLFTQWFSPREFATLSGLLVALGTFGTVAASTPLALLVEMTGWRGAFISISILTGALAVAFHVIVREGPYARIKTSVTGAGQMDLARSARTLLRTRDYWLISCGTFFRYGTLMAVQGLWAGPYLLEHVKLSPVSAGNIMMLAHMGYIVGAPLGGFLSDRILASRKYVAVMGLGGMVLADLALTTGCDRPHLVLLIGTFFSLGVFAGFGNVMYAHIKGVMPSEMTGMALAGINFFTMFGAGAFIHAMGWVMDYMTGGDQPGIEAYRAAFFLCLVGVAAAALLYLFTHESREWEVPSR